MNTRTTRAYALEVEVMHGNGKFMGFSTLFGLKFAEWDSRFPNPMRKRYSPIFLSFFDHEKIIVAVFRITN
jgi:hypothetical protein